MPSTTVLMTIAIYVISFAVGFLAYYLTSNLSSTAKRKNVELMISYLINLVLFIWVAKVVMQLPLFLSDPIAVLAYPSNAQAFYLALLLLAIQMNYQVKKHGLQIQNLLVNYIPVLVIASFTYQFMDIVWRDNPLAWGNFVLMMFLLLLFLLVRERMQDHILLISLIISWLSGKLILSYLLPFTTIFGYMIHPLFLITVSIISLLILLLQRERVSS
ncbi:MULTISPECIES: hypothetical protein [Clostridia]|uniref:hypothetical protein n=1 Tax=Clostridia TaxID=186801 RepID=UPI000EA0A371|nr:MULTISPECIES: hypothetical protein [Clostridia]NBJ70106.1 hypothetical protein [Roseburia sp. 1XD42-34]RKI77279.1 hypothetical protein D7V87_11555 [Clostridium sp. 1xD42-85]